MNRLLLTTALLLSTSSLLAQSADSVRSRTRKFFAGVAAGGASINVENSDVTEKGGSGALILGYGFSPRWAGVLEAEGATINSSNGDYVLGHFDIGVRFHFANARRRWIPFLDAALTGRAATQSDVTICNPGCQTGDLTFSGAGFTFGGGVSYYARPSLAISGNLKATVGEFSDVKFRNTTVSGLEEDATTTRLHIGVTWFPSR